MQILVSLLAGQKENKVVFALRLLQQFQAALQKLFSFGTESLQTVQLLVLEDAEKRMGQGADKENPSGFLRKPGLLVQEQKKSVQGSGIHRVAGCRKCLSVHLHVHGPATLWWGRYTLAGSDEGWYNPGCKGNMNVVRRKELFEMGGVQFSELAAGFKSLWLDIGAGDGDFIYRLALENPGMLCVGIEPAWRNMSAVSSRALRKAGRGGAANVLFVQGSIETPPPELEGRAARIFINFPWSGLLRGLILPDTRTLRSLRSLGERNSSIEMYLNYSVLEGEGLQGALSLPAVDQRYIEETLSPAYQACGFRLEKFTVFSGPPPVRTSWGNHLTLGSRRETLYLELRGLK